MRSGRLSAHMTYLGRCAGLAARAFVLTFLIAAGGCAGAEDEGRPDDYLTPELRAAVEQLKADVAMSPTGESTIAERARILADWVDAYALGGGEVGLEGPRVRLQSTLPPTGQAALRQGAIVDRLVRQFTLHDEPGGLGELTAESLGPFEARSHQTIRQTWTAGTRSVATGGGFWVARHFNVNYGPFQTDDPAGDGYATIATTDADATFEADVYMARGPHGGFRAPEPALVFRVASGQVDPGETVTITYGDTSGGGRGLLMTGTSSARMPLPLYVDLDASGEWRPLPILPFVVSGTRVAGVHGFAPSVVAPGEPFELSVRAQDAFFNRATGAIPAFEVRVDGDVRATTPAGTEPITVVELTLDEPGPHWVEIRSADGEIRGGANPVLVEENPARRIYWGDTHGHSGYAEGIGTIDFFMTFARDDARLDFVTHSEHDVWLDDAEWELSRSAVQAFDEPGRFIPYLGWEWTRHARFGGHHNVLFRDAEGKDRVSALEYPTLSELYQGLHARYDPAEVLVIPHAHNPGDYRQSDPQLEPLIEMMSMHGTFEWFVRQYLSHGHQVGLVAASDDHLSHPGYSAPNRNSLAQRGGLGAVLAPEKSRDAIFDAMKQRRTYATTGDRIILDVTVNGTEMGQRGDYADERTVEGRVIGTAPIESVTLLKNDEPIWSETYGVGPRPARRPRGVAALVLLRRLAAPSRRRAARLAPLARAAPRERGGPRRHHRDGLRQPDHPGPGVRAGAQRRPFRDQHARRHQLVADDAVGHPSECVDHAGAGGGARDRVGAALLPAPGGHCRTPRAAHAQRGGRRPARWPSTATPTTASRCAA